MDSSSSSGTDVVSVRVDESMVRNAKNKPRWWGLTTNVLIVAMHIQWMIMAPLLAYLIIRMSYSSDENWITFVLAAVVVLLLFMPILLVSRCWSCCSCCRCGDKGGGEQLSNSR